MVTIYWVCSLFTQQICKKYLLYVQHYDRRAARAMLTAHLPSLLWENLRFKCGPREGEEGFQGALKIPLRQTVFLKPNSDQLMRGTVIPVDP